MPDTLYGQLLDIFIVLRDTRDRFSTYSAKDINALISSKMKSVREPVALQHLYKLEEMISKLRESFTEARQNALVEEFEKKSNEEFLHLDLADEERR